jgi:NADH dehydrogenase
MEPTKILLIGGTGFVGAWVASRLSACCVRVVVPTRHRDHSKHLLLLPTVDVVEADVHDPETLVSLMQGADAVVNLVGILHDGDTRSPYGKRFAAAHVDLPRKIVAAMRQAGVRRLLHMSALRADADAPSAYLRSKAAGEAVVREAADDLAVTVFRPSVIFGPGDKFLNTFASLLRLFPVLPLGGCQARFQPVFVGDVADAFVACLAEQSSFGQVYELGGPAVYSLRELVEYTGELIHVHRRIIALPEPLAYLQAAFLSLLPNPPMTPDNLRSMRVDSVSDGRHSPPGWQAQALEAVAPSYLCAVQSKRRLDGFRCRGGR